MRFRALIGGLALVFLAGAGNAHAGWFNWGQRSSYPEPAHPVIEPPFHRSASEGAQIRRQAKEYDHPRWGSQAGNILRHPVRPITPHLYLKSFH